MTRGRRAGFSFVEALVVLAITSVLLILLASVSTGGMRAGFRAAARADAVGERLVGTEALRVLVRGVQLPEPGRSVTRFVGDADGFTAAATPGRPTACNGGAPTSALVLRLERSAGRTRLVCGAPGRPTSVLLDLGEHSAAFAYALAGRPWSDSLTAELPPDAPGRATAPPRPRLWIRLASASGIEVVEQVSARPPAATRT